LQGYQPEREGHKEWRRLRGRGIIRKIRRSDSVRGEGHKRYNEKHEEWGEHQEKAWGPS
jgi:hypothetical protein